MYAYVHTVHIYTHTQTYTVYIYVCVCCLHAHTHTCIHTRTLLLQEKLMMFVPEVSSVLPHMHIKIVFPFGHIATLSTHEIFVLRVSQHVF